jgi:lipid II:glycine glycyltransferase (peptidoglycan interpeptide bridge formation enzyme)
LGFEKALKQVQPRATLVLDHLPDLEQILMGFEEKTRYNIRLAERKGVSVKEDGTEQGINQFFDLYQETAQRDKFLVHPRSYYKKVRETLFKAGLGTNFIAFHEGKPVAAVIIFSFGERIWYMYGASASASRNVMPNHLLHWEVIKWAKAKGYRSYDLWGIPANPSESHPLYGVYRFKKGFRGEQIKYIGAYDFPYSPLLYHAFEYGVLWWQNLRSLITKGKIEDSLSE